MDKKPSHISSKQQLEALCDFLSDIIIDPLFFAFAVFMLFIRIQTIIDFIAANPTYSFWVVLEVDMHLNLWVYITFLVVFALWMFLKGIKYRREKSDRKQLTSTLEKINTSIADLQQVIRDLPDKIVEAIKSSKNEGNESK